MLFHGGRIMNSSLMSAAVATSLLEGVQTTEVLIFCLPPAGSSEAMDTQCKSQPKLGVSLGGGSSQGPGKALGESEVPEV